MPTLSPKPNPTNVRHGQDAPVVILFHRLGPYHIARLRTAGALLPILALETSGVDKTYAWDAVSGSDNFARKILFDDADAQLLPPRDVARRVHAALDELRPEVIVIPGWSDSAALAALQWSVKNCAPAVILSDSSHHDEKRVWWKDWVKSRVVACCSAALAGGSLHAEYLARLGMKREHIFLGYDAVDNDYFAERADDVRTRQASLRRQLGLRENFFLASARFVEKKNLERLIQAYARYRALADGENLWDLVLLGDGPLRGKIETQIEALKLGECVRLPGFQQYENLPNYYGLASVFVHASVTEQWGLVVNEAMASGLPVLVSDRCGCAVELVRQGRNGFTFDPCDTEALACLMQKISARDFPLTRFGAASRKAISRWGTDRFARGLRGAVDAATQGGSARVGLLDRLIVNFAQRR